MAVLQIPEEQRTIREPRQAAEYLAGIGIDYERWEPAHPVAPDAPPQEILDAYAQEIERLKRQGGYVTADVIDVSPGTPNLQVLLDKFNKEHWHDEDEVRFVIEGRGVFHIHPEGRPVVAIQVGPGDLIRVPRGTRHWFDLCEESRIRCIRLFQDSSGWTPHYTDSGVDRGFVPVCLGPSDVPIDRR
jgi:1,2-dihydroxy-3-keto-5-methylthiopentene dioxygenase